MSKFVAIYYRNCKEYVGGSGRLRRLATCLKIDVIDCPIVNNRISRNIFFYLFQSIIISFITLKHLKSIINNQVIIYQPLSLPAGIFVVLTKILKGEKVILDDFNLHGWSEYIPYKLFAKSVKEIWTSSLYTIITIRKILGRDIEIKYVPVPLYIRSCTSSDKQNIILYVASKSFKRYIDIGREVCKLAEIFSNYLFLIIGSICEELKKDSNCIKRNIILLGHVPDVVYEKLLERAKYLIVFDTVPYIYKGGMPIKLVDAIEHCVIPIISYQYRYNFPFINFVYSFEELREAILKGVSMDFVFLGRIYSCSQIRKTVYKRVCNISPSV